MPRYQNQSPESWTTRLLDALYRFGKRRALQEMMTLRSDRLLADIGFSRETLADEIQAAVETAQLRRRTERQIRRELSGYSDRELNDLGISRLDIRRIAREHAAQTLGDQHRRRLETAQAA